MMTPYPNSTSPYWPDCSMTFRTAIIVDLALPVSSRRPDEHHPVELPVEPLACRLRHQQARVAGCAADKLPRRCGVGLATNRIVRTPLNREDGTADDRLQLPGFRQSHK